MKVKELIAALEGMPPDAELVGLVNEVYHEFYPESVALTVKELHHLNFDDSWTLHAQESYVDDRSDYLREEGVVSLGKKTCVVVGWFP